MVLESFVEEMGEEDAGDEAEDGDEMMEGPEVVVMQDRNAEEDTVARHGGGEDVAVIDIDEGVKRTAGEREKDGGGKGADGAVLGD